MSSESVVSASDWLKGISLSILASIIGGASKLAIRKSWIMMEEHERKSRTNHDDDDEEVRMSGSGGGDSSLELTGDQRKRRRRKEEDENRLFSNEEEEEEENPSTTSLNLNTPPSPLPSTPKPPPTSSKTTLKSKCLRYTGMLGMTILNPLCCVLAMNYASPSILAPFSGLTLVWIVMFAEVMIGEKPSGVQVVAAGLIVGGQVMVAVWGDHVNDGDVGVEDVIQSYKNPYFLLYFLLLTIWMLFLFYTILSKTTSPLLQKFAWGVSGGSLTGLQNFLKDSLTLIKASSKSTSSTPPPPYLYIILFLLLGGLAAFGGLLLLTSCMKRYDATYSASMFVVSFVVSASVMAAVHYRTFENLRGVANYVLYPLGLGVLLLGALILVRDSSMSGGGGGRGDDGGEGNGGGGGMGYSRMETMEDEGEEEGMDGDGAIGDGARLSSGDLKRPLVDHQPKIEFL